jgi:mycothiol synthase
MTAIDDLGAAAQAADGVAPFNEATLLSMAGGETPRFVRFVEDGAIIGFGDAPLELAVHPDHRGSGLGRHLADEALGQGETRFWAHGDLPAAQALAASTDLVSVRTLLVLRRPADPVEQRDVEGVTIRTAGEADVDAVVTVNARAFASHPEQGAMDRADFERRASSDWFDWAGLFVAERDGEVVGFHWTKVEDHVGEVYVVGVDPSQQGTGLGTALTARGLQHLVDQGVEAIDLYVEGDNDPALAVYRRLGFTEHARDVLYAVPSGGGSATV